jgi:hypothetical protein
MVNFWTIPELGWPRSAANMSGGICQFLVVISTVLMIW